MHRVFNCGVGMTVQLAAHDVARALAVLRAAGQEALVIGEVRRGARGVVIA
jgi:phosphoribosylformylglycinamidine cyclo-ligase